jgi:hypothetical protein
MRRRGAHWIATLRVLPSLRSAFCASGACSSILATCQLHTCGLTSRGCSRILAVQHPHIVQHSRETYTMCLCVGMCDWEGSCQGVQGVHVVDCDVIHSRPLVPPHNATKANVADAIVVSVLDADMTTTSNGCKRGLRKICRRHRDIDDWLYYALYYANGLLRNSH